MSWFSSKKARYSNSELLTLFLFFLKIYFRRSYLREFKVKTENSETRFLGSRPRPRLHFQKSQWRDETETFLFLVSISRRDQDFFFLVSMSRRDRDFFLLSLNVETRPRLFRSLNIETRPRLFFVSLNVKTRPRLFSSESQCWDETETVSESQYRDETETFI